MSSDSKIALEKVTYEQLVSFLLEKRADRPCECCGHDKWTISTADDGIHVNIIQSRFVLRDDMSLWACFMGCENCGNLRFVTYSAVLEWVRANKVSGANDIQKGL